VLGSHIFISFRFHEKEILTVKDSNAITRSAYRSFAPFICRRPERLRGASFEYRVLS
jgi:hypothetical protein